MKNIIVISFYESSNIGDLELSSSIDRILKNKNFKLLRYNFSTGEKIENININSFQPISFTYRNKISKSIKLMLRMVLGQNFYNDLVWKFKTSRLWDRKNILIDDFQQAEMIVFAGGNMIMDVSPTWPYIIKKYIEKAIRFGKPFYFLYVGVGPLNNNSIKILKECLSKAKGISVRDEISRKILSESFDIRKIVLTADPVFSDPKKLENVDFKSSEYLNIAVCVLGEMCFNSKKDFMEYLMNLEILIGKTLEIKLRVVNIKLFSTELLDYPAIELLKSKFNKSKNVSISKIHNLENLYEFYNNLNYLIGGRMHSMIIAQKRLLPFIGIKWQKKIDGFSIMTNSEYKMYSIASIRENASKIVDLISNESLDFKIIIGMNKTNLELQKIVADGDIIK